MPAIRPVREQYQGTKTSLLMNNKKRDCLVPSNEKYFSLRYVVVLLSLQDTVQTGRYVVSAPSFLVLWWAWLCLKT